MFYCRVICFCFVLGLWVLRFHVVGAWLLHYWCSCVCDDSMFGMCYDNFRFLNLLRSTPKLFLPVRSFFVVTTPPDGPRDNLQDEISLHQWSNHRNKMISQVQWCLSVNVTREIENLGILNLWTLGSSWTFYNCLSFLLSWILKHVWICLDVGGVGGFLVFE